MHIFGVPLSTRDTPTKRILDSIHFITHSTISITSWPTLWTMNIGIWRPGNRSWLLRLLPGLTSNLNPITLWWSVGGQCCDDELFIRGHCSFSSSHPTFPLANLDTYDVFTVRSVNDQLCNRNGILSSRTIFQMFSEFNPRCYPSSILDVIRVQSSMLSEFNPRCFPSSILDVFRVQSSMFSEFNPWCFPSSILDVFRVQSSMFFWV